MLICNHCGNIIEDELRFCTECGEAISLNQSVPPPVPGNIGVGGVSAFSTFTPTAPLGQTTISSTLPTEFGMSEKKAGIQNSTKIVIGSTSAVAIIAIAIAIYFALESSPTAKLAKAMENAVNNSRLVTLSNDDAYSYFFQLRGQDPTHKALKEIAPKVLPQLRSMGDEAFRKKKAVTSEKDTTQDWARTLRIYEWANALEPTDKQLEARLKFAEGEVAKLGGRKDDAERFYSTAAQLNTSWALPQNSLGLLRNEGKRWSDAIPYFQRCIDLEPNWEIPYNNMGTANFYLQNYSAAENWYRAAIERNSNWARPHYWLGTIYEKNGWKAQAIEEFQIALNLGVDNLSVDLRNEIQKRIEKLQR
jgi:tetratricopeptide (TPR) repeat protein